MHPPKQKALIAAKVPTIPIGLFAHVDYLETRGTPTKLADLVTHDLIGSDRNESDLSLIHKVIPNADRSRFVIRTDSHPAQLAAARAGLGIAVVHKPLGIADPLLRPVLPNLRWPCLKPGS